MKIEKLSDLFLHTLQDIYYAENHIVKALPKMIAAGVPVARSQAQGCQVPSD